MYNSENYTLIEFLLFFTDYYHVSKSTLATASKSIVNGSSIVFRWIARATDVRLSAQRHFACANFRLKWSWRERIATALRHDLTVSPTESEIASIVDHTSEADQAAVTKYRKSRRKKSKNAAAAAAGDSKVRFSHLTREVSPFVFLAIYNFICNLL